MIRDISTLDLSVIIPFYNHADMTIACIDSLMQYGNGYTIRDVLLINNNSSSSEAAKVQAACAKYENARMLDYPQPFNFQTLNNWAVKHSEAKTLLFLNNDVELTADSKGLLQAMYQEALKPSVGAVGAVLLYNGGEKIQHAGIYLVPEGTADHLYARKRLSKIKQDIAKGIAPFDITSNLKVNAVTAACLMVEREKFDKVHGYNERFIIGGGDVDLCFRLNSAGFQSILVGCSSGTMLHKESETRSTIGIPYIDFYESYNSYINHYDLETGDPFLPWKEVKSYE